MQVVRTPLQVARHRDKIKEQRQRAAAREHTSLQRAKRNMRAAPWANRKAIKALFDLAEKMTVETCVAHEVDHIIPLLGRRVSGLHVENNLRVVPREENRKKSNHYEV
ncbi:MAG: hypothetical protein ACRECD_13905 [Burkholderiaceae bacterium]